MLVYKYRGGAFNRDLESLKNDKFWASNTKQLNDPCEGLVKTTAYQNQIQALKNIFNQHEETITLVEQSFQNILEMKDTKLGIFSLSKRFNDELLWAHYADSHKGFCIEYELDRLLSKQNPKHRSLDIQYVNKVPNIDFSKILNQNDADSLVKIMLGFKSKRWEYENELRIITENQGLNSYDFRAVKAIYFGLKAPNEEIDKIMQILQGREVKYFQMKLIPNSFELEAEQITDKFPTCVKYKYSISPIAESAFDPANLKSDYQHFSPYLQKLAEIVRREPDCYEVTYVDISLSKSSINHPIFFAQYKTQEDDFYTQTVHYTTNQIDAEYDLIDDL